MVRCWQAMLLSPDLLRPCLLPLCDAVTAMRLLASDRTLRRECKYLKLFEICFPRRLPVACESLQGLAACVGMCSGLRALQLGLDYQNIGSSLGVSLAAAVAGLSHLITLRVELRQNRLGDVGATAWFRTVASLGDLVTVHLGLGLNSIRPVATVALTRALIVPCRLSDLSIELDLNSVGDEAAVQIASSIRTLHQIDRLKINFAQSGISSIGANALISALREVALRPATRLNRVDMDLRGNQLKPAMRGEIQKCSEVLHAAGCDGLLRA